MASGAKCFILNRESDWKDKSIIKNFKFSDDKFISYNSKMESSIYISKAFDSTQDDTVWHRLRLFADASPGVAFKILAYAADDAEVLVPMPGNKGQTKVDLNEYISDPTIDINRKVDVFEYIGASIFENCLDVLLYSLKGRYLWLCFEVFNNTNESLKIDSMKIEFPQISFVEYLPEIYKEGQEKDCFFQRFIGIFQSIYTDLEDKIDFTPLSFDVDRTSREFLNWIGDWLSVQYADIWGEKKLRKIIKEAVKIYKLKGTKKSISKIVQEYAGVDPIIVEQFDVKNNMYYDNNKEVIENLFGDNGYTFTVMLPQSYIEDSENYVELLKLINKVKPVDSICNLVALSDQIYLNNHCYMGINSFITTSEALVLNTNRPDTNNLMIINSAAENN